MHNHNKYKTPLQFNLIEDEYGNNISLNTEYKTSEEALEYFNKLKHTTNNKLNYYEDYYDFEKNDLTLNLNENENVLRMILIKDKEYSKKNKLKLGIITIDLEDKQEYYREEYYNFLK